jgi:hypothetical protein
MCILLKIFVRLCILNLRLWLLHRAFTSPHGPKRVVLILGNMILTYVGSNSSFKSLYAGEKVNDPLAMYVGDLMTVRSVLLPRS